MEYFSAFRLAAGYASCITHTLVEIQLFKEVHEYFKVWSEFIYLFFRVSQIEFQRITKHKEYGNVRNALLLWKRQFVCFIRNLILSSLVWSAHNLMRIRIILSQSIHCLALFRYEHFHSLINISTIKSRCQYAFQAIAIYYFRNGIICYNSSINCVHIKLIYLSYL